MSEMERIDALDDGEVAFDTHLRTRALQLPQGRRHRQPRSTHRWEQAADETDASAPHFNRSILAPKGLSLASMRS